MKTFDDALLDIRFVGTALDELDHCQYEQFADGRCEELRVGGTFFCGHHLSVMRLRHATECQQDDVESSVLTI